MRKIRPDGFMVTIAGNGVGGYGGDGGAATNAMLSHPAGVAMDGQGNLYIADYGNSCVRKVDTSGVISTFAGTGIPGFSGDEGPASYARMTGPMGVAIDAAGALYVTDFDDNRIRKVSTSGIISSVGGTGTAGAAGDAGPARQAQLSAPVGITVDLDGAIYFADAGNSRIRMITPSGVIGTFAGGIPASDWYDGQWANAVPLPSPMGVAVTQTGDLLVCDAYLGRVGRVDRARNIQSNYVVGTYAGNGAQTFSGDGGPALLAGLGRVRSLAADGHGNVFIGVESGSPFYIRKIATNGVISAYAGNGIQGFSGDGGPATAAQLMAAGPLAADSAGNLYIADWYRIRKVGTDGIIQTIAGTGVSGYSGDGGPASSAQFSRVTAMTTDPDGNLYFYDYGSARVRKISKSGVITTVAGTGVMGFSGDGGLATTAQVGGTLGGAGVQGLATDRHGNLYLADTGNRRIRKISSSGIITTIAGNGELATTGHEGEYGPATAVPLFDPYAVAVDSRGYVYFQHTGHRRISPEGMITSMSKMGAARVAGFQLVMGPSDQMFYYSEDGGYVQRMVSTIPPDAVEIMLRTAPENLDVTVDRIVQPTPNLVYWSPGSTHTIAVQQTTVIGTTRYAFSNWNDGGALSHTVTAPASSGTYTANFIRQYALITSVQPDPAAGSITVSPLSSDGYYNAGTVVQITAVSSYGYKFDRWQSDRDNVYQNPKSITMDQERTANALFYKLIGVSVYTSPPGLSLIVDSQSYVAPAYFSWWTLYTIHTVSAPATQTGQEPGTRYQFVSWSDGGAATHTVTATQSANLVTATYDTYRLLVKSAAPSNAGTIQAGPASSDGYYLTGTQVTLTATPSAGFHFVSWSGDVNSTQNPITVTLNSARNLIANFAVGPEPGLQFYPVSPCRIMDTRASGGFSGAFGPPSLSASSTRSVPVPSSSCGIPATAQVYSFNVTVIPKGATLGYLTIWPAGQPQPPVSTLNSWDGKVIANAALVPAGIGGAINVFISDNADLVIDINGYFVPPNASSQMFYPLAPCRVLDTRNPAGTFGGPFLSAGVGRSFPLPSSSCGIPASAGSYSLNVTVVPKGPLGYLTVWPTGQPQPLVSTLNSWDGTTLANAAIVPGGSNGAVSFYASNDTDLLVDINGYFAPPGPGGLKFYAVAPCRAADTRNGTGTFGGPMMSAGQTRAFPLPQSACGLPDTAQAYSLNVTVVPPGTLYYLSVWPVGMPQPGASTLNDYKGLAVANAALVPAGTNGAINAYVTNSSQVIIDVNGFFGP